MIDKSEVKKRIAKKDNRFVIRLKPHEWRTLRTLSDKWKIENFSGVMHRLIAISEHLVQKYDQALAEKEALLKELRV